MKATHLLGMVCAACASLLLFSCTDPEPEEPQKVEVTSVTLNPVIDQLLTAIASQ